ncbi:MAG TPA: type II CAAX endopeptidase family protein [Candidatus Saccharimonadales bacterium]|nr:type II CAAX endopeptidase family protein [Candidatus Saccharimonadales bacterium]
MIAGLAQRLAPESRRQGRDWTTGWSGLLLVLGGAAAVMLLPRVFGDPQSVDPDVWRLTGYFGALAAAVLLVPSLRRMVPVALALLTLTFPYSCWLWLLGYGGPAPSLIGDPYGLARNAFAGSAWLVLAAIMAFVFYRLSPNPRPRLRIWVRPGRTVLLMAIGVSLLFLAVAFLLPAPLIGREGVPLLSLGGSAGVAYGVANATQAIAQEIEFRGVLLGALERQQSRLVALVTQALIFGVAHIAVQYQGPADSFIPIVILLGLIWGWMTQRSNSILPAAVVHVVAELFLVAAIVSGLYGQ